MGQVRPPAQLDNLGAFNTGTGVEPHLLGHIGGSRSGAALTKWPRGHAWPLWTAEKGCQNRHQLAPL